MSALGQKRTYAAQQVMSALPPIATAKADFRARSCALYPQSGHVQCKNPCPLWAKSGLMRCNKKDRYSITSSARAIRLGGTVRPSAFAVFRFMTSSYLLGACTGRSAGFSPRSMRSTYAAARRY
jgi:hypothetical protein